MSDEQHCPNCWAEYVAGVAACVDCGGPLTPGPLPRERPREDSPAADAEAGANPEQTRDDPDALLDRMPGEQAESIARALGVEGIPCLLECRGIQRLRRPGDAPAEPLAVTLPVAIYVPRASLADAQAIARSLGEDAIRTQWEESEPDLSEIAQDRGSAQSDPPDRKPERREESRDDDAPQAASSADNPLLSAPSPTRGWIWVLVLILGALLYAFGKSRWIIDHLR